MFIGAINSQVRAFLAELAPALAGQTCVVGCSGNFTSETVLTNFAKPRALYSNDVSLYSCLAGAYLTGQDFRLTVQDETLAWLPPYLTDTAGKLAAVMVLLDMLQYEKQNNRHKQRMWGLYVATFPQLYEKTLARIAQANVHLDGYYAGDVAEHFRQHDEPGAVFMCYAPTYSGGYERMYKRLDEIMAWDEPTYAMLDEAARDQLLGWMQARRYVWYDDRLIPGLRPVMIQKAGRQRTVYIYSNLATRPIYVADKIPAGLPKLPLATGRSVIQPDARITLQPLKTSDLARYKNAFLGKNILFGAGNWAYAVTIDGTVYGFLEFSKGKFQADEIYINSDFAIPGTRYERISKLMPMLAVSGETRRMLERINVLRLRSVMTTAFTARPVSMKYRGVLELVKRGQDKDGKKFLNYQQTFNALSWQETLQVWLTKHGSLNYSTN